MNRSLPLVRLFERRTRALRRQLAAAVAGKDTGVHQAWVASRRLREAIPVLTEGLQHPKAGKAQRKIRRLTQALGTVRELDVTLHLIDELSDRPAVPRTALAEVRALVIEEREKRRSVMLHRLEDVDEAKLGRRLQAVKTALVTPAAGHAWRAAAGASKRQSTMRGRSTRPRACTRSASRRKNSATSSKSPTRAARSHAATRSAWSSASRTRWDA